MKDLITELKKTMIDTGLSPEAVAKYVGCCGNEIRRWIKGQVKPRPIYLEALRVGLEKIKREHC